MNTMLIQPRLVILHSVLRNTISYVLNFFSFTLNEFLIFQNPNPPQTHRSYPSTSNGGHSIYRPESLSQVEQDDVYRLQRLYQQDDEQDKYKNRFDHEHFSNTKSTAKLIPPTFHKAPTHDKK